MNICGQISLRIASQSKSIMLLSESVRGNSGKYLFKNLCKTVGDSMLTRYFRKASKTLIFNKSY